MKSIRGRIIKKLKSISPVSVTSFNPAFVFHYLHQSSDHPLSPPKECDDEINDSEIFKDFQDDDEFFKDIDHNQETQKAFPMSDNVQFLSDSQSHQIQHHTDKGDVTPNAREPQNTIYGSDIITTALHEPQSAIHESNNSIKGALQTNACKLYSDTSGSDRSEKLDKLSDFTKECKISKKGEKGLDDFPTIILKDFEEKCPPGGKESVVFYTTSFRGIRKTFEECSAIRFLLESFGIMFDERDISLHLEYREELWTVIGRRIVPPRLFIRGRDIGGADEVVGLHEEGVLRKLLKGIPLISLSNRNCCGCGGVRFVLCLKCNGSRKITTPPAVAAGGEEGPVRCLDCNENGLVKCPICSFK